MLARRIMPVPVVATVVADRGSGGGDLAFPASSLSDFVDRCLRRLPGNLDSVFPSDGTPGISFPLPSSTSSSGLTIVFALEGMRKLRDLRFFSTLPVVSAMNAGGDL